MMSTSSSSRVSALSMILACAAAACGGSDDKPAQSASDVTTTSTTAPTPAPEPVAAPTPAADPAPAAAPAPAPAPAATYSDAQIAGIVLALNKGEIEQAKTAQKNAKNPKVKAFASKMVSDHTDADHKENALLKKKKLTSADSDKSSGLTSDAMSMNDSLKAQKGADFDKSYIDMQVKMHQDALNLIDNTLLAQVQDPDQKALLTAIRGKVADHLKMAQDIQSSM
jgi:putative membrane protein